MHVLPEQTTDPEFSNTVGFVGIQGEEIAGTQGIGTRVKTPNAAAVAAAVAVATVGLARLEHMTKVAILSIGTKSITLATG
jgi:hypothetical protein